MPEDPKVGSASPVVNPEEPRSLIETRRRMSEWAGKVDDPPPEGEAPEGEGAAAEGESGEGPPPTPEEGPVEAEGEVEAEAEEPEWVAEAAEAEPQVEEAEEEEVAAEATEEEKAKAALEEAKGEAPERETPEAREEGRRDRPYKVQVGEGEWDPPEDFRIHYRADGKDRERTFDELVQFAQKGENYDRRSQELSARQRHLQENYQKLVRGAQERIQQAEEVFSAQVKRFFEDAEYRQEALREYQRLTQNPEELRKEMRARQADDYEQQIERYRTQERQQWQARVWQTVDQVIEEARAEYPYADPATVRKQFAAEFRRRGQEALSDHVVREIIEQEHTRVAGPVNSERSQLEQQLEAERRKREELEAKLKANENNTRVKEAVERKKEAEKVTPSGSPPVGKKPRKPSTMKEAREGLKAWADASEG